VPSLAMLDDKDGNFDIDTLAPDMLKDMEDGVETGFQLATFRGPLCDEPLQGTAIFIDEIRLEGQKQKGIYLER
jgi:ribosome assembly protein 1